MPPCTGHKHKHSISNFFYVFNISFNASWIFLWLGKLVWDFWGLMFGPEGFLGFVGSPRDFFGFQFFHHSINPITWNPEYCPSGERLFFKWLCNPSSYPRYPFSPPQVKILTLLDLTVLVEVANSCRRILSIIDHLCLWNKVNRFKRWQIIICHHFFSNRSLPY